MSQPKIRFGLRHLFLLVLIVGLGLAYYVRPSFYASTKMDFGPNSVLPRVGVGMSTAAEDHCIRLISPKMIDEALSRYPELGESIDAMQLMERGMIDAVPNDAGVVEIRVFGEAADKEQLELLAKGIAESYQEFLGPAKGVGTQPSDTDFEVKSGWGRAKKR